ncbi:hypothetical protein OIU91_04115 [Streptomyces sp. NBC_01456]|uniref:hypothetical protein n=1 Tax=unclassified Streptomyces TaxID=2593676 RepID=UPI002E372418|nr:MULTISPECIES: hypothetical protein [unclassified Streptomyces]
MPIGVLIDNRGSKWSVYGVRRDEAGEVTGAYIEFSERADGGGLSAKNWGLQSPHWTKGISSAAMLKLFYRIEYRMFRHEHPDFFECVDCSYVAIDSEFAAGQLAREWLAGKGWPVGSYETKKAHGYTGGGVTVWRFEIPTEEAHESSSERSRRLAWY